MLFAVQTPVSRSPLRGEIKTTLECMQRGGGHLSVVVDNLGSLDKLQQGHTFGGVFFWGNRWDISITATMETVDSDTLRQGHLAVKVRLHVFSRSHGSDIKEKGGGMAASCVLEGGSFTLCCCCGSTLVKMGKKPFDDIGA